MMHLLAGERPYLFSPAAATTLRLCIEGDVSMPELRRAIRSALRANPPACTHIVLTGEGDAYFEPLEDPACTTDCVAGSWTQLLHDSERRPFDVAGGEMVRIMIIPGSPLQLLISGHLLVSDGAGLMSLAHDIMTSLTHGAIKEHPPAPGAASRSALPLVERVRARMLALRWQSGGRSFTLRDRLRLSAQYPDSPAEVALREMGEGALSDRSPADRDALLAAALAQALGGRAPICLSASLRGEGGGMGNHAVNVPLDCRAESGQALCEAARAVSAALRAPERDPHTLSRRLSHMAGLAPTLIDAAYFAAYDGYGDPIARQTAQVCGYLGEPEATYLDVVWASPLRREYDGLRIASCAYIPPLIPGASRALGAVELDGRVTLTLRGRDGSPESALESIAGALAVPGPTT